MKNCAHKHIVPPGQVVSGQWGLQNLAVDLTSDPDTHSDIEGHDYEPDDALEDDADDNIHGLGVGGVDHDYQCHISNATAL